MSTADVMRACVYGRRLARLLRQCPCEFSPVECVLLAGRTDGLSNRAIERTMAHGFRGMGRNTLSRLSVRLESRLKAAGARWSPLESPDTNAKRHAALVERIGQLSPNTCEWCHRRYTTKEFASLSWESFKKVAAKWRTRRFCSQECARRHNRAELKARPLRSRKSS